MEYTYDPLLVRKCLRKMVDAVWEATEHEQLCQELVKVVAAITYELDKDALDRREAQELSDLFDSSPDEVLEETPEEIKEKQNDESN